jgi:hypothetical protein
MLVHTEPHTDTDERTPQNKRQFVCEDPEHGLNLYANAGFAENCISVLNAGRLVDAVLMKDIYSNQHQHGYLFC